MTRDNDRFRELVLRFQQEGDRSIIEKIRDYMRIKFHVLRRGTVYPEHAMYIAFAINVLIGGKLKTAKYFRTPANAYAKDDLHYFRKGIMDGLGVDIFEKPAFGTVLDHCKEIAEYLGSDVYESLICSMVRHRSHNNAWADETYERVIAEIESTLIIPALEYALFRVDTSKSEREIVRYTNRAFRSEYIRLQMAESGTRRLGRKDADGRYRALYVQPRTTDIARIVFGRQADLGGVALRSSQRRFVDRIYETVGTDVVAGNMSAYRLGEDGGYRIKNRYIADKLDMEESVFSRGLGRIAQKLRI
ncbi:hypothetical protein [Cohnella mopanensis]|uniref:hypothetical protein n=1 Tax=Cohnella mopanensis TaxID=2911966 RepID=UPI001EF9A8F2|nr:hypothetical protein [Cohnella mopanensis]